MLEANIQKKPEVLQPVMDNLKMLRDAWDKISATETRTDRTGAGTKGSFSVEG